MKDYNLYLEVIKEMRLKQQIFYDSLAKGFALEETPVKRAASKYFKEKNNGSN